MSVSIRTASIVLSAAVFAATIVASQRAQAAPLSSAFTYQGELYDMGQPLVGSVDLRFTPYADASNPAVLGPPVVVEDVLVSAGIFTAQVDFGPGFFVGDAVFLEVAVRPFDSVDPNAFETLAPRQEITAAPYSLKPAPGSVTDIELASDAVGTTQIADSAVASADIADGSVAPQDLNVSGGGFDTTFWRVGGNTGTAGLGLGTLDNLPLALFSPVGVTINGPGINSNTELTLRGNASTPETNVDLTLWPRAGEAFFNLGVVGTTPADTRLQIHTVGTNPFSGFIARAQMNFDGALGLGGANPAPLARLHVTRNDLGFDIPADASEAMELVIEDVDAQIGLYSEAGGAAGSVIGLAEMTGGAFVNQWGLYRRTTPANAALQLSFGSNSAAASNPVLFHFGTNASLGVGSATPNSETELFVAGTPATPGGSADIGLVPQGGSALFNWSAAGTNETDTTLALQFTGSGFNYEPRLRFGANGAMGVGRFAGIGQADSFVFADDSSASVVNASAANQFIVRATGGIALNGEPENLGDELTIRGSPLGFASTDIVLHPNSTTATYRVSASGSGASNAIYSLTYNAPGDANPFYYRMVMQPSGFLSINPDTAGGYVVPQFPLTVGTNGDLTNGNGAHINANGTYSSSSSRLFKEAFTAIDAGEILDRLLALPITRWRYRGENDSWHLGPVSEEFHAAFGLGNEDQYIVTVDADGVALAAIQGLSARTDARTQALESENAALRESLAALAARVDALERGD